MSNVIQKIIFGSPGTGKSHLIQHDILSSLIKDDDKEKEKKKRESNVVNVVFHPEYTYGDFMGKLLPISTESGNVEYRFYEGHFLKALSYAYRNLVLVLDENGGQSRKPDNVVLVIDEINRGNSSAIFGSVFQLLDRDDSGWSSYETTLNGIVFDKFQELIFNDIKTSTTRGTKTTNEIGAFKGENFSDLQKKITSLLGLDLNQRNIKIPPNLHIIATMNTSDSSIYYMDTAFKRRWEWQFIDVNSKLISELGVAFYSEKEWVDFIAKLNNFIKSNHSYIRGIEDKQIGRYFIKAEKNEISYAVIQSKLMFFIWDSVFNRDKKPLTDLLKVDRNELVTFGDFAAKVKEFIKAIQEN